MFKKTDKKSQNLSKHPSLPGAGTSKKTKPIADSNAEEPKDPYRKRCCRFIYNRETKQFCGRTCQNWFYIIIYSIMYIIFLSTYTLICLYGSLTVIKFMDDYQMVDKVELLTYSKQGIGLTATPTSLYNQPVIWYRNNTRDYQKYISALEKLISKRKKRDAINITDLGPCGSSPFGYGENPCIIIRINKQLRWAAKPLSGNVSRDMNIPKKVQDYLKLKNQMLWLHCNGVHSYDKEHIGSIKYYPNPPGFAPDVFSIEKNGNSPLVAVQLSKFTLGLSLAIECKLWYLGGVSSTEFILYVTPMIE